MVSEIPPHNNIVLQSIIHKLCGRENILDSPRRTLHKSPSTNQNQGYNTNFPFDHETLCQSQVTQGVRSSQDVRKEGNDK